MYRVGLTGNIASGKSEVAKVWRSLGAPVIDADQLSRDAVAPGSPGYEAVVRRFGPDVVAPDGAIDRAKLRDIVFVDAGARADLEAIVHPEVERLRREQEEELAAAGESIVVHEVPLLFETGLDAAMDAVVFVDAPADVRRDRLIRTRRLRPDLAEAMISTQAPPGPKRARARIVVENDGTLEELRRRAEEAWREIQAASLSA